MKHFKNWLICGMMCTALVLGGCGSSEEATDTTSAPESTSEEGATEESGIQSSGQVTPVDIFVEEDLSEIEVVAEDADFDNVEDFITLGDYTKLALSRDPSKATGMPDGIAELAGYEVDLAEGILGATVTMDYAGTVNGEAKDGMSADNADLTLGSGQFIPGFEDQLVGAKAGETVEVDVTFPENYQAEDLAGQDAVFMCTIHRVWRDMWDCVTDISTVKKLPQNIYDMMEKTIMDSVAAQAESYGMTTEEYMQAAGYGDSMDEYIKTEVKWALVNKAVLASEGIDHDSDVYQEMLSLILAQSDYESIDDAIAAGISEENVHTTTEYYTAIKVALQKMGKI
ncbi:MAG: FKBP-type peptidyl-prolyl cis-trans isomerase [Lachnospiraceae bacterium]|nr:FKBP-type peptidyl-prolyl cis-trans isomerase [Candidatus Equihabitans merdae]